MTLANVFVVPNKVLPFGGESTYFDQMIEDRMKNFDYAPVKGEKIVQVWTVSPERPEEDRESWSENWSDHGMPMSIPNKFRWPSFFPASLLPKTEGETVTLTDIHGEVYTLTAKQLEYRYRNHGTFEQALEKV